MVLGCEKGPVVTGGAVLAVLWVLLLSSPVVATVGRSPTFAFDTRDRIDGVAAESGTFAFDTTRLDGLSGSGVWTAFALDTSLVILRVDPSRVIGSNAGRDFRIIGGGFTVSSRVTLRCFGEPPYRNRAVASWTPTEILIRPIFGTDAARWTVEVTDGGVSSGEFGFDVEAPGGPQPEITFIVGPAIIASGQPQQITMSGLNVTANSTVMVMRPGPGGAIVPGAVDGQGNVSFSGIFDEVGRWFVKLLGDDGEETDAVSPLVCDRSFKMVFPIEYQNWTPTNAAISAVFDHRGPTMTPDGTVRDVAGEEAYQEDGYRNVEGQAFLDGRLRYVGAPDAAVLEYDGHNGYDYPVPIGTAIRAVAEGRVTRNSFDELNGYLVEIDHGNGYTTLYGHLSGPSSYTVGGSKRVGAGVEIAKSGNTGESTGAHLHFGVTKDGNRIDPYGTEGEYGNEWLWDEDAPANMQCSVGGIRPASLAGGSDSPGTIASLSEASHEAAADGASSAVIGPEGGILPISVAAAGAGYTARVEWGSSWLSLLSGETGGETGEIEVACATNTGAWRAGRIVIEADIVSRVVDIAQDAVAPGLNPESADVAAAIRALGRRHEVPPVVVAAVMAQASGWRPFDDLGQPLAGEPGKVGIMGIDTNAPPPDCDVERLLVDWTHNLEAGVRILSGSFLKSGRDTPNGWDAPQDTYREVLENWFYPVAWYWGSGTGAYAAATATWASLADLPSPAGDHFASVPDIGDPTRISGFPATVHPAVPQFPAGVTPAMASASQLVSGGGYSLALLKRDGQELHGWHWGATAPEDEIVSYTDRINASFRPMSYREWKDACDIYVEEEAPDANLDGDGMPSLLEFALGCDPRRRDRGWEAGSGSPGVPLCLRFAMPAAIRDVAIAVETSTNLIDWVESGAALTLESGDTAFESWRADVPAQGASTFMRLKVLEGPGVGE